VTPAETLLERHAQPEGNGSVGASRSGLSARALADSTRRFTDAFNRNDLDGVMAWFTDDIVYEQFDGQVAEGRAAVREAFAPQFAGAFGRMRFDEEDCFVDAEARRALISWTCSLDDGTKARGWQGLDILHFADDGRISRKLTYGKARKLVLRPVDRVGATAR
jgi:ketosteroid isomerase-like protein